MAAKDCLKQVNFVRKFADFKGDNSGVFTVWPMAKQRIVSQAAFSQGSQNFYNRYIVAALILGGTWC